MDGRTRLLTALANEKPDRLPCQVHSWMKYYLDKYLGGVDQYAAYGRFGMDPVIYAEASYEWRESDLRRWRVEEKDQGTDSDRVRRWVRTITTPKGTLREAFGANSMTCWHTEHLLKKEEDFALWKEFCPTPKSVDWSPVIAAKNRIGRQGIVRGCFFDYGQGSPWQSFMMLTGTEEAIFWAVDEPDLVHELLEAILERKLRTIEAAGRIEFDLVETGGGGGSSTVISPAMHAEFCLPYDKRQHAALHEAGTRAVYHLCGGVMPLLHLVAENGADALETMTPPAMGGDCDLAEATRQIGHCKAFIGGFNQSEGFERGSPEAIPAMVQSLHHSCPDGGYICSPSDHFFEGDPANVQAFVDAVRGCAY